MPEAFLNHIDGRWVEGRSGRTAELRSPAARTSTVGTRTESDELDAAAAVAAARRALEEWRLVPPSRRALLLARTEEALRRRSGDLVSVLVRETGRTTGDASGEVEQALRAATHFAGEGTRLLGGAEPVAGDRQLRLTLHAPVGVAALITPASSPLGVPTAQVFAGLVAGNTVVLKPSEVVPGAASLLVACLEEAGVPAGVVNLLLGGVKPAQALARHPDVGLVALTGSVEAGTWVAEACAGGSTRVALNLGGSNGLVVLDDADPDLALEGALWGGFASAGQRCAATRRLILHRRIADSFLERLVAAVRGLRLGPGQEEDSQLGPLLSGPRRDRVHRQVEGAVREGATVVCGGGPPREERLADGWYYAPTLLAGVRPSMKAAQEEIFGPVLAVLTVDSLEEAIHVLNDTPRGLCSSVYTRDVSRALRAVQDVEASFIAVNAPTTGTAADRPDAGTALDVYTERKHVVLDPGGSRRAGAASLESGRSPA